MQEDDEKLKKIYSLARKIAHNVSSKYHISYLDEEDFAQEAVMGWLEGRNMYLATLDALRRYGPLTKDGVARKEVPPNFINLEDGDALFSKEVSVEDKILADQVMQVIQDMPDYEPQYAVLASFFGEDSLQTISHNLGYRSKRSAFELRRRGLDYLREKLGVTQ